MREFWSGAPGNATGTSNSQTVTSLGAMAHEEAARRWWPATAGDASVFWTRSSAPIGSPGRQEIVRETCDWFCQPEYRALGVGLHLMRRMMAKSEPILVIGGTELHPKLAAPAEMGAASPMWATSSSAFRPERYSGLVAHKRWHSGIMLARVVPDIPLGSRSPRLAPPSANSQARVRARRCRAVAEDSRLTPSRPHLTRRSSIGLQRAPDVLGQFVLLSFFCDGEPMGITISRLQELPHFGHTAQIVHLHPARFEVIDWMVSETVHHLIAARRRCGLVPFVLSGHGAGPCPALGFGG